jgi:hypothetical protein
MVNLKPQNLIFRKLSFKRIGILLISAFLGITIFICSELIQANAASSSTVLPILKGGTGANSASSARNNLQAEYIGNKISTISSSSNNTQYPGALAVYDYVKPLETGTLSTPYFDLYYEKRYDKTVYIWVANQYMKTAPTSSMDIPLITLPASLKEDITKQYYSTAKVNFCPHSSSIQCKETILYIGTGGTKLSFASDNGSTIDDNYKYLLTTPLIYKTA